VSRSEAIFDLLDPAIVTWFDPQYRAGSPVIIDGSRSTWL
jgi:hypothetical protein